MEPAPDGGPSARAALAERILGHLPGLTRFVRRRMGPDLAAKESASDIVQSTCRELLRSASSFEDRGEASFERWLRSAAEHKLQNRARHWGTQRRAGERGRGAGDAAERDEPVPEPAAPNDSHPSHDAMLREEAERLARAFRGLTPEYRQVLQRSQIDGATHAELAHEMGRTSEAVRKLVARALARLAAELEPDEGHSGASERTGRTPVT